MRYFLTLFSLRLKSSLCSALFLLTAVFVLALSAVLAAALPQGAPISLRVGVLPLDAGGERAAELLARNGDYEIVRYDGRGALERAVLTGAAHCGYLLGGTGKTPVTVLETEGSFMRPLLDELVLAAWLETQTPSMAGAFLAENGFDPANAPADFERLRGETIPMTVRLESSGQAGAVDALAARSIQPLLYAVLISAFLALALMTALLEDESTGAARRCLAVASRRPFVSALAPAAARILLNAVLLTAADLVMNSFVQTAAYSGAARLAMLCALAAASALLSAAALPLRCFSGAVMALLPPALLVSVLCSGALLNPALLPDGLGILRFLSPAWYGLQILARF